MFYVEWIEQPLRITDLLAIDEPVNINTCNKWEKVLKADNISPSWRGKRHFVCLPNIHTFSSALSLFENKTIAKQLYFILFSIVILFCLSPYDIQYTYTQLSYLACQWQESFPSAPTRSFWGFKTPFPNQRIINIYMYIYKYKSINKSELPIHGKSLFLNFD